MADTKKGGNSIVWSWREVAVENCTCMSVEAGMYCGPERTPGIANDSPCGTSCGRHCWDLGYVDAATGYFISKGFPVCGGPDAPPLPDPIAWVEFPTLTDLNTDGVPPCQRRATSAAFMQQAGLQAELQDQIFRNTPPALSVVGVNQHRTTINTGCTYGDPYVESCICESPSSPGFTRKGCPSGQMCITATWTVGTTTRSKSGCVRNSDTGVGETDWMQRWFNLNLRLGHGTGIHTRTQAISSLIDVLSSAEY